MTTGKPIKFSFNMQDYWVGNRNSYDDIIDEIDWIIWNLLYKLEDFFDNEILDYFMNVRRST